MRRTTITVGGFLAVLLTSGCAVYEPRPLDPEKELMGLRQRDLAGFVVERRRPGDKEGIEDMPFSTADGLDEGELIAVALTLNPDLRAKRLEIGEAQALLITAGIWPNPAAGAALRPGIAGAPGWSADADLLFELLRIGERSARTDVALARIEEVRAEVVAGEWALVAEVRRERLAVLSREDRFRILQEEATLRERVRDLIRRRREIGDATDLEVALADVDAAEVKRDVRLAETALATARRGLNRILGLPAGLSVPLAGSGKPLGFSLFEDVPDEDVERRLLQGRFDLRAAEAAYDGSEHELRLAIARQGPKLGLGPTYGLEPEGEGYFGLGVSLEIPLFDRNQGEIAEKQNQREQSRAKYVALLHRLRSVAFDARENMRRAKAEVEAQQQEVVPLVQRTQDLFERAFRARDIPVFEWMTVQQRALKARQAFLEALLQYEESRIEFEAATGLPLSERSGDPGPGRK